MDLDLVRLEVLRCGLVLDSSLCQRCEEWERRSIGKRGDERGTLNVRVYIRREDLFRVVFVSGLQEHEQEHAKGNVDGATLAILYIGNFSVRWHSAKFDLSPCCYRVEDI